MFDDDDDDDEAQDMAVYLVGPVAAYMAKDIWFKGIGIGRVSATLPSLGSPRLGRLGGDGAAI